MLSKLAEELVVDSVVMDERPQERQADGGDATQEEDGKVCRKPWPLPKHPNVKVRTIIDKKRPVTTDRINERKISAQLSLSSPLR